MPYDPLFGSVQKGDFRLFMRLLSRDDGGINSQDETGQTLLHVACGLGQVEIVLYLLQRHDCDFQVQEQIYGHSPLHTACFYEQHRIVQELLKLTKSNSNFINRTDKFGWSALHHAARNGNLEICQLLVANGANPFLPNEFGKTPCHYAVEYDHTSVLTYLYDYVESTIKPPVQMSDSVVLEVPTLLHCAAMSAQSNNALWLKERSFPPAVKCTRILDYQDMRGCSQYPDEVADSRGNSGLKANVLLPYRLKFQEWINDIAKDKSTLDRIKLCICGYPRVGKSAMRESLSRPYFQQLLGGKTLHETDEDNVERHTFGIEIKSMQLNGKDLFSVWDFAGQIESFITHQFFISTQSTVFTVLIKCTDSLEDQRKQLLRWLGFIKTRNLGQVPFCPGQLDIEKDIVQMPNRRKEGFGSILQPVPVVVIGSHYDLVPVESRKDDIAKIQSLVNEVRVKFEEYLDISPRLYPLDCLTSVSPEITSLRDHLCEVRSKLVEVQPVYPRVIELVARKTESLRSDQPDLKVMMWDDIRTLVHDEVNKLLSERQLAFVLQCLTNAGVLVYFNIEALANYIFIDPGWLCKDVLGKALAPEHFPISQIASVGSVTIPEETLRARFEEHVGEKHVSVIIDLLQHFGLCYCLRGSNRVFEFPTYLKDPRDPERWKPELRFTRYSGRCLTCTDETDTFPPGFFSRLQVLISRALQQEQIYHFKGCVVIDALTHQCLVEIDSSSTSINLIGRAEDNYVQNCIQLIDVAQIQIASLIRNVCPTIFLELKIPSSADLKCHVKPDYYSIHEIVARKANSKMATNDCRESVTDLLYMGDEDYQQEHEGKNTKLAYLPIEIILQVQELLSDGDTDWKDLAKAIGLEKYIQLLENRAPESTRLLLLKWAEKPRWTVNSFLYALKQIRRLDVYGYVEERF